MTDFFFKFCMGLYLAKIYTSIVFGDAAPSVPSFIGLKVIFWLVSGMRSAGHISWFSFLQILYGGASWSNIHSYCFGDAVLSVVSFIGSKVTFWLLSCVHSACYISRVILFFRFCMFFFFAVVSFSWCCPQCSTFYRVRRTKSFTILFMEWPFYLGGYIVYM